MRTCTVARAVTALVVLLPAGVLAGASPAQAACEVAGDIYWGPVKNKETVYKNTNVHSKWTEIGDGVAISYSDTKTGELNITGNAGVEFEAGIVLAKAKTSFGVSVGKTWSKSQTWSYEWNVEPEDDKTYVRVMMKHEAKRFSITKYKYATDPETRGCKKIVIQTWKSVAAPTKRDSNDRWVLQYK